MIVMADIALALAVSLVTVVVVLAYVRLGTPTLPAVTAEREISTALFFEEGLLQRTSAQGWRRIRFDPGSFSWNDLCDTLEPLFPGLPCAPGTGEQGTLHLEEQGYGATGTLDISWNGPHCWVHLTDRESLRQTDPDRERDAEQRALAHDPNPSWQIDDEGRICWANAAYRTLSKETAEGVAQPLFPLSNQASFWRAQLPGTERWYQVSARKVEDVTVCNAHNIDGQVRAEADRLTFMQTLVKTFAHLPTGLAIFDRDGRLALFNPALVDLTGLSAAFLSGQPPLATFFDQLRNSRRMPEPKDYTVWRTQLAEMTQRASGPGYQDTWTLEDGRTFRVQGRPQPDGATAFLFDDVTAEIMMTRSFRREVEMGQNLLDLIEDGIIVFSRSGVVTFTNAIYRDMWGQDPDGAFADVTIRDCLALWQERARGPVDWQRIEGFVRAIEEPQACDLILPLSRDVQLHLRAIAPGARMIRFRHTEGLLLQAVESRASSAF
ncbi:MAG: PAS-domain containing protein [Sulfitobacter sp.]|nr:PAS-domain containing protein [Sulfitobacter sp.]